jgi:hypothetical protein
LNSLLEHADLLAILLTGLDAMLRRSDVIGDSLTSTVGEFAQGVKAASADETIPGLDRLRRMDLSELARGAEALSDKVIGAAPAMNVLLSSRLTEPESAEVLVALGDALVEARCAATGRGDGPRGLFGILKAAKDPDVARGIGFLLQTMKSFGRQLK